MSMLSQSSRLSLPATEAFELLRYAPLLVQSKGGAVLHYRAPLGIWDGAPVHYHLLQGMVLTTWQGVVRRINGFSFTVSLPPHSQAPFRIFRAEHSMVSDQECVEIQEEFLFETDDLALHASMSAAQCVYLFAGRRLVARKDSEAITTSFEAIPNSRYA